MVLTEQEYTHNETDKENSKLSADNPSSVNTDSLAEIAAGAQTTRQSPEFNSPEGLESNEQDKSFLSDKLDDSLTAGMDLAATQPEENPVEVTGIDTNHFRNQDLRNQDLSNAYLHGTDISGSNLSGQQLQGQDLSGANLQEANLKGADLRNANLVETNLSKANLEEADLTGADLRGANLIGTNLEGAKLPGIPRYSDASFPGQTVLGRTEPLRVAITRNHEPINKEALALLLGPPVCKMDPIPVDVLVKVFDDDPTFYLEGSNLQTIETRLDEDSAPVLFKLTPKQLGQRVVQVEFY